LLSDSEHSFKEDMSSLENKIISNPKGLTSLIPATFYPIEYLNIYFKSFELVRIRRRTKIGQFLVQSVILYTSPLVVLYYDSILKFAIPPLVIAKTQVLLIIYFIITIITIITIARNKHAFRF